MYNISSFNSKLLATGQQPKRRSAEIIQEKSDLTKILFIMTVFMLLAFILLILFTDSKNLDNYFIYKTNTAPGTSLSFAERIKSWFSCKKMCNPDISLGSKPTGKCNDSSKSLDTEQDQQRYDTDRQCWNY